MSHEDNQGAIAQTLATKMPPRTKLITIKYHHFQIIILNVDVVNSQIGQVVDIFTKTLDCDLFGYVC